MISQVQSLLGKHTQVVRMTLDYKDYHFITESKLLCIKVNMITQYNSDKGERLNCNSRKRVKNCLNQYLPGQEKPKGIP